MRRVFLTLSLCLSLATGAAAQIVAEDPALARVFALTRDGAWDEASAAVPNGDAVLRDLVTWMKLRSGGLGFEAAQGFLARRDDWPQQRSLREEAEKVMPETLSAEEVKAWFEGHAPQTGRGVRLLAEAHLAMDDAAGAATVLRDGWLALVMEEAEETALRARFESGLSLMHAERAAAMLDRGAVSAAERLLPVLDGASAAEVALRIAVQRGGELGEAAFAAAPAALRAKASVAADRFNQLAARGDRTDAMGLLRAQTELGDAARWANWRRVIARWQMREGEDRSAYLLAATHGLEPSEGEDFADLEWLAGYIALRKLNEPAAAVAHFQRTADAVDGAISLGRAWYWTGRAHLELGNAEAAQAAFARAAEHQSAFYGQLAAERLARPLDPALAGRATLGQWRGTALAADDRFQALQKLIAGGERAGAVAFVFHLARELEPDDLARLGAYLEEAGEPFFEIFLGKTAATRGIFLPAVQFPLHPLAERSLAVAPEIGLAFARRESEFNPVVGSPAGALGLMQLMPGTAEEMAGFLDLPYSRGRLTADWAYNAELGTGYLARLYERFGDGLALVAVGYNAGPRRADEWVEARGDPRNDDVDIIDWLEHIPFRETRNYVQRVAEAVIVYRARLGNAGGGIGLEALLRRGLPPVAARPVSGLVPEATLTPVARPETGEAPSDLVPERTMRPVARPSR